jgi:hypothetical protein
MTIEIHKPELEALIREWMDTGAFPTVEDALMQALKSSPRPSGQEANASNRTPALTGTDLVAAMQASPYKELDLEPTRNRLPVRDVGF